MSRNIRIRTEPNGGDKRLKIQLNQDFDFLEILSLKISQEDVYRSFHSDYGVVVGRVIINSGVGVPNARISVFIPLTDEDAENPIISSIYPYKDLQDVNSDGIRYNTLPNEAQGMCHTPIGTFPTKREIVDNPELLELYGKYFKYTTTTNEAGDFMLFGVPVGNHMINIDVDLSDIGFLSQRPYDFIEDGNPNKLFESPTKFKKNNNLNNLTQVKNRQVGVNVIPFWGEKESNKVGISRIDVDLNYNLKTKAIFIGSIFGDNEKDSVNKNCRPRRGMGKVCNMGEGEGTIQMLRKTLFGDNERFDVDGGRVITDKGTWAYQIPMNLDYMVTNEFGDLVPTDDPSKGIPTRARVRFKIKLDQTGGENRLRSRANHLIPHNPKNNNEIDYNFDNNTTDNSFRDFYWNKVYTVKNHIARFQKNDSLQNRNFVGFKDVDDCVGVKTPLPFNKMDTDFNPLYAIVCVIISIILNIIKIVNKLIKGKIKIGNVATIYLCRVLNLDCIRIQCDGSYYTPGCSSKCDNSADNNIDNALNCFQIVLAIALNIFKFDFYNEWLNGALYSFLFKYKKPRSSDAKFCGDGNGDDNNFIINTNPEPNGKIDDLERYEIDEGLITSYKDELFYKPLTNRGHLFYATDIYNLGAVFPCDWQQRPKIVNKLTSTSYQVPPLLSIIDDPNTPENEQSSGYEPLFFKLNCIRPDANSTQSRNIRRISEIGVGVDDEGITTGTIDNGDIEDVLLRSQLIKLNDPNFYGFNENNINSNFGGSAYNSYRKLTVKASITQFFGNSFFFYFGTQPNNSAIDLMNSKYFTECAKTEKKSFIVLGNVTNVSTVGGSDGSITISIIGGTPSYEIMWYNHNAPNVPLGTQLTINNLEVGSYFVVVTDNNGDGVEVIKNFIVNGLQSLNADIIAINASTVLAADGKFIFNSITGGIGPYNIRIVGNNNPTNLTFNNVPYSITVTDLSVGSYTITVSDSNNNPASIQFIKSIELPDVIHLSNEVYSNAKCINFEDGSISFKINGGTPDFDVTLVGGGINYVGSEGTGHTYSFNSLPAQTYQLTIIDEYNQNFGKTITLANPSELILRKTFNSPTYTIYCDNTLSGVNYDLVNDVDIIQASFIGNGSTILITTTTTDPIGWQVSSQHGCLSNIL